MKINTLHMLLKKQENMEFNYGSDGLDNQQKFNN